MIEICDLSFSYPGAIRPVLRGVSLQVPEGELCLVIGLSGSGKSTLLRCINGLVPHFSGGSLSGLIRVNAFNHVRLSPREMSQMVGFVFQDPEAQFVVDRVEDEIAFSLENTGIPNEDMEIRMKEVLNLLELSSLRTRRLETLSGGELQRVAIAAALVLRPKILVLDEPTSQLDPHGADEVLQTLMRLNKELGLTVVLAEHRLERVIPYAGQIMYLSNEFPGGLTGKPRDVLSMVPLNPPIVTLGKALGWEPLPLTVEEAQECMRQPSNQIPAGRKAIGSVPSKENGKIKSSFIEAKDVHVSFGNTHVLQGVDLELYPGEITVMEGTYHPGDRIPVPLQRGFSPTRSE